MSVLFLPVPEPNNGSQNKDTNASPGLDVLLPIVEEVCPACLVPLSDGLFTDTSSSHAHVKPHPTSDPNTLQMYSCRRTQALDNEPLAKKEAQRGQRRKQEQADREVCLFKENQGKWWKFKKMQNSCR